MHDDKELHLPEREEHILKFWEENQIFEKTLEKTKKGKPFIFYEGPPFANGHPGIHHVEARVFKDVFLRFKTMRGFFVRRKAGWDTHGLPVELQVEKELGLKNKRDIERYGVGPFNQKCRDSVWKYKTEWDEFTKRIGFWIDLKHPYITYDTSYIESLWFIIKRFWETKALYQDYKIIPWCPRCGTGLSSHELGQPGAYRKVKDPSLYVKFKIKGRENEYLLIWTTTPWTLPGNVAVAINPDIEYRKYKINSGEYVWSATENFAKDFTEYEEVEKIKGKRLLGLRYETLYPQKDIPYTVIAGDFVTTEDGTGIVHIAPAFGEDDMAAVKKEWDGAYPILKTVAPEGTMEKGIIGEGLLVRDANKVIGQDLEKRGLLMRLQWYEHDYPHCWRCDTPLIYIARQSWWVKKPVEKLLASNKKINWVPEYIKEGRFGEWLREKKDWAFSRERYWGTALPIWQCGECKHTEVIGDLAELSAKSGSPKNTYLLMRHGESEANMIRIIDDSNTFHLTEKGKKEVQKAITKLKKQNIDMIVASDILRTKETAEMIGKALKVKVYFDPRLREIHLGVLCGKLSSEYHKQFPQYEDKYIHRPEGGENLADVRTRMMTAVKDLEEKYSGKTILIVSHEYPIWQLWTAGQGMSQAETISIKEKLGPKKDFLKTGEVISFPYKKLPYSHTGEVDLHRPFIDEIGWACAACKGRMKRVPEVCDVWFDSGAMPFAEDHFPFAFMQKGNTKYQNFDISKFSKIPKGFWFPADFISEGIDQTRGWFYTLLTIATLLGFQSPYKNVISLGHVLDSKGQKMSKSKGNVVNPGEIIQKYGIDSLRWYFYTINAPGDSKAFDEKDVANKLRGFLATFWNSYLLFETYAPKRIQISNLKSQNILDQWVVSKLQNLIHIVTTNLNAYDPVGAARSIEEFLINDFSQWFLRRSRRRFQKPENQKELSEVSAITAYVLLELAKLSAPFVPFFADIIFQKLRGHVEIKDMSVHLAVWPKTTKAKNASLLKDMEMLRSIVSEALKLRAAAGVKVRQPLASLQITEKNLKNKKELLELIRDELNVKEIVFGNELKLDTDVTPELKEEGAVRDIVRQIQEMRKDGGFKPSDKIILQVEVPKNLQTSIEDWMQYIRTEVGAHQILFGGKRSFKVERDEMINNEKIWFGIRKC